MNSPQQNAANFRVSKTVFWDARDRSTHHLDYPSMTMFEYKQATALAKALGEQFKHGESVFERATNCKSEQTRSNSSGCWVNGVPTSEIRKYFPKYATTQSLSSKPIRPPCRILAKLVGTQDSLLPSITLYITSSLTTWGRGFNNKLRHANPFDTQVPKYALKIGLWQLGAKPSSGPPANKDNTFAFYIASKARHGIKVNGVKVPSHNYRQPERSPAKFWGKLQHGDLVDVWMQESNPLNFVRFRFDWGESMKPREEGQFFSLLEEGLSKDELESFSQTEKSAFLRAKPVEAG